MCICCKNNILSQVCVGMCVYRGKDVTKWKFIHFSSKERPFSDLLMFFSENSNHWFSTKDQSVSSGVKLSATFSGHSVSIQWQHALSLSLSWGNYWYRVRSWVFLLKYTADVNNSGIQPSICINYRHFLYGKHLYTLYRCQGYPALEQWHSWGGFWGA